MSETEESERTGNRLNNRLAIAGVACALVSLIPLYSGSWLAPIPAALGLAVGIFSYRRTNPANNGDKTLSGAAVILGSAALALFLIDRSVIIPRMSRLREENSRIQCGLDMRTIGQALRLYADDRGGAYPPDLGVLVKTCGMKPDDFICTNVALEPPANMSVAQAAAWVDQDSTYVYAGAGLTTKCGPSTILLYEKDANHDGNGMNILFADNHWEFHTLPEAHKMIEEQMIEEQTRNR